MKNNIEIQQSVAPGSRFFHGLLSAAFLISNTIFLVLLLSVFFSFIGSEIQRLFYWIGIALLHIFTYPQFRMATGRNKIIMLLISVAVLILSIVLGMFLRLT